jgi:DNA-binding winged helix-turn-helix (wHTH) protein/tetratricopeptide (TPR) repeat protein
MQVPATERRNVRFGSFEVDLTSCEVRKDGRKIKLQEKPFQILAILLDRPGELVTREEFRQKLWPSDTFVDFEQGINTAVKKLREALQDHADEPRYIETLPKHGYRFIAQLEEGAESGASKETGGPDTWRSRMRHRWYVPFAVIVITAVVFLVGLNLAGVRDRWLHGKISEQDTILLADFVNKTGDPVFDDALKQALAADLGQSPFLNVLSDRKVGETLRMMGRPSDQRITAEVGRELCLRTGSKAVVDGTVARLGSHYLIELSAVTCRTGDTLAKEAGEATSKEDVLKVLSRAASNLRTQLGESLLSVQKFDVPLEATTTSLEALDNYSMATKVERQQGDAPGIPFLKRAIELDPNFPMAYAELAILYGNLDQPSLALECATKAYELRDRVTEREKLIISAAYFDATGELEKGIRTYQLWTANYPRDPVPYSNLGAAYSNIGQHEKALVQSREGLRLSPDRSIGYAGVAAVYIFMSRLEEAKVTLDQALAHKLDSLDVRQGIYFLAFLRGDTAQMAQQVTWGAGNPGNEDPLLSMQSDTEAYSGQLRRAREFSRRAVDSAVHADSKEAAAFWQVNAALREAELGNSAFARRGVKTALAMSSGRNVKVASALTLARTGDTHGAKALIDELEKSSPSNTMLKLYWLPTINASIELSKGNSSQALTYLEPTAPYEMGLGDMFINYVYPAYVRGQAYLLAHNGSAAAAEFQKLLDHRGIVLNFVTGSLARLGLARAYAMQGDTTKARAAYQDFLTLWKDADPDVPVLKEAKAEYAKLQ